MKYVTSRVCFIQILTRRMNAIERRPRRGRSSSYGMEDIVRRVFARAVPQRLQDALRRVVRIMVRWALADEVERLRELERKASAQSISLSRLVDSIHSNIPRHPGENFALSPSRPGVSIVTATWNRAHLLPRAIESMLAQTWRDWEMIIVDDGSTDATESVVRGYLADPRIRYFRQAKAGAAVARNRALEESRGEIIGYLDSDCQLYPAALDAVAKRFAEREDLRCAYFGQHSLDIATGHSRIWAEPFDRAALMAMRTRLDLNAFFHRRRIFEELGGFDESVTRLIDWELILRYTEKQPPEELAVIGSRYESGHGAQISNTETIEPNRVQILERRRWDGKPALRVLYATDDYPQLSESYVENEIKYMREQGVEVLVWSKLSSPSPYPVGGPVFRGPFGPVVRRWRPDVIHAHYLHTAEELLDIAEEEWIPVTVRAHAFDITRERLERVSAGRTTAAVYVFPHLIPPGLRSEKIRPLPAAIDTVRFSNGARKDRQMVLRSGAGLPTKDMGMFMEAARRLPGHRFVLAVAEATGMPEYVKTIQHMNESMDNPVEIRVNVPYAEVKELSGEAGIYLHTCDPAENFGMPVSIGEAMAAGCYVLVRNLPGASEYIGKGGACYESVNDAVTLIKQTGLWTVERWEQQRRSSVESARRFANDRVLDEILDDWRRLAGVRKENSGRD